MDYLLQLKDVLGSLPDPLLYKLHLNKELREVLTSNKIVNYKNIIEHIRDNNYPSIIQSNIKPSNNKEFMDWIIVSIENKCHHIYDHFYEDKNNKDNLIFLSTAIKNDNVYVLEKLRKKTDTFTIYNVLSIYKPLKIILYMTNNCNFKFIDNTKNYNHIFIELIAILFNDEKISDYYIKELMGNDLCDVNRFKEYNIELIDEIRKVYKNRTQRFINIFGYNPDDIDNMIKAYDGDNFKHLDKFFFNIPHSFENIQRIFNLIISGSISKKTFESLLKFNRNYVSDNDIKKLIEIPNKYNVFLALLRDRYLEVFKKYKNYIDGEIMGYMEDYSPMILKEILDNFSLPKELYINISDYYRFYKQRDCIDVYKKLGIDLYKIRDGVYRVQRLKDFIRRYNEIKHRNIRIPPNIGDLTDIILKFSD